MKAHVSILVIFYTVFCSCQDTTTEYFDDTTVQTNGIDQVTQATVTTDKELREDGINRQTTTEQILVPSTEPSTTEKSWPPTTIMTTSTEKPAAKLRKDSVIAGPSTIMSDQTTTAQPLTAANSEETWKTVNKLTNASLENNEEDSNVVIDKEIANAILKAKLEPRNIPDKIMSGSFNFFSYEAGLNNMKLYNLSSFARNGPAKIQRTKFGGNVELELILKSDSLILNGSAVLYFLGIGPKFEFEGKIDSVSFRVLLSYHKPDDRVFVKNFKLLNEYIKPSLKITKPRSITKFVTNIFLGRIVPNVGRILLPTIEKVGREIVHELVSDHGFVHSVMRKHHSDTE